jgi:hypothetical protein
MKALHGVLLRRTCATLLDTTIEISGGVLGSYFGMMVAALLVTVKDGPADQMQSSMWSGFGFGLVFWTMSLSFMNRVLIQGISRASIGKKVFRLELISTGKALTWNTILGRWMMGYGSLAIGGIGYLSAFFDKEGRTFHDIASHTDVVPIYVGSSMSVEYHEEEAVAQVLPFTSSARNTLVISHSTSERPMATVIQLPITPKQMPLGPNQATLAKVVRIGTDDDDGSGQTAA